MIQADLTGRKTLVTGGASGIGLATSELFARSGADGGFELSCPTIHEGLNRLIAFRADGLEVIAAPGSIAVPGEAEAMVETAISMLGGLDYLFNNAGTPVTSKPIPPDELDKLDEEFWQTILTTNLIGPFRCARAAAPALKRGAGAIVNTASSAGLGQQGSSSSYAASKSGLVSLTRSLARGLGPEVRVNAVAPGAVNSPWQKDWPEEYKRATIENAVLKAALRARGYRGGRFVLVRGRCDDYRADHPDRRRVNALSTERTKSVVARPPHY